MRRTIKEGNERRNENKEMMWGRAKKREWEGE